MDKEITLEYGAGGMAYRRLVQEIFVPAYGGQELKEMGDSAVCTALGGKIAFTTDGFVVDPIFFPGGDVGSLAVSGTVNDLAVSGAVPRFISVGMIIEAGFSTESLEKIAYSIAQTAKKAGVRVVTGDTKVVSKGHGDGIYITTSGVGTFDGEWNVPGQKVCQGDAIIVSSKLASHGMAVMNVRENLGFMPPMESDAKPLYDMIKAVLSKGYAVNAMRDATRGGLAATVCEWAESGENVNIVLEEKNLPVRDDVAAACAILGLDPMFAANEGVCVFSVPEKCAEKVLNVLHSHPDGRDAAIVGKAVPGTGRVLMDTGCGSFRRVTLPAGELLPRIC